MNFPQWAFRVKRLHVTPTFDSGTKGVTHAASAGPCFLILRTGNTCIRQEGSSRSTSPFRPNFVRVLVEVL